MTFINETTHYSVKATSSDRMFKRY